jgi:hypothetical protein
MRLGDESEEMGGRVIGGQSLLENESHLILRLSPEVHHFSWVFIISQQSLKRFVQ